MRILEMREPIKNDNDVIHLPNIKCTWNPYIDDLIENILSIDKKIENTEGGSSNADNNT